MRINIDLCPGEETPEVWVNGKWYIQPGLPEPPSSFKVGDFVKVVGEYGEIVVLSEVLAKRWFGVKFPKFSDGRHNLNGACPAGHGWWYCAEDLEVVA